MSTEIEQLHIAMKFMADTPTFIKHHDELWWTGDMPAEPDLYNSEHWEKINDPVWKIWDSYLGNLYHEADVYGSCVELWRHYQKAFKIQERIKDLLQGNTFKQKELPLGAIYFHKTTFDFYEIMGWEYITTPAAGILDAAWDNFCEENPDEVEKHRHQWQGTFELDGADVVVYLEDEYDLSQEAK